MWDLVTLVKLKLGSSNKISLAFKNLDWGGGGGVTNTNFG